jgi:hypothetical protein
MAVPLTANVTSNAARAILLIMFLLLKSVGVYLMI